MFPWASRCLTHPDDVPEEQAAIAELVAGRRSSSDLVEDHGERFDAEVRGYLGTIIVGGRHIGGLIDGLPRRSRSTRGDLRCDAVEITAMGGRILDELARDEPQRRVCVAVAPGLEARGDARMVEVVLRNLLSNAWKYTPKCADPEIRVEPVVIEGQPGFRVADNGAGVDMAHAGKLFQPFQRLRRPDELPGIGLATAQRIVHRHGGSMRATAEPGRGACVDFCLPTLPGVVS